MGVLYHLLSAAKIVSREQNKVSALMDMLSKEHNNNDARTNLEICGCSLQGGRPPYINFEAAKEKIDFHAITSLMYSLNEKGLNAEIDVIDSNGPTFYYIKDASNNPLFIMQVYKDEHEDPEIVSIEISCDIINILNKKEVYILENALD